ncbi:DUF1573 domain-containing protein [Flavobacterium sp.]|uniref:DUF1573 domain-containing protein n=1 Tax=Flavobacterium sp. TaxID=239 RepID=UPI002869FEC6|nr:DUF1573 domain-containing protein [Flavobacterium sp.]
MNRKFLFLCAFSMLVLLFSCKKKETSMEMNMNFAKIDFSKRVHDFGTINEGDKVKTSFSFTNTSDTDLIITQVYGSCGCTVPEYPREPVKTGEKKNINISFDSHGKSGVQDMSITIISNTYSGIENLGIKAIVTPKSGVAQ